MLNPATRWFWSLNLLKSHPEHKTGPCFTTHHLLLSFCLDKCCQTIIFQNFPFPLGAIFVSKSPPDTCFHALHPACSPFSTSPVLFVALYVWPLALQLLHSHSSSPGCFSFTCLPQDFPGYSNLPPEMIQNHTFFRVHEVSCCFNRW